MQQTTDITNTDPSLATMRLIGFTSLALGALSGLILGLWSFDGPVPAPALLDDYASTSRRLVRLGHIAFFGLGILNILTARELAGFDLRPAILRLTARSMNAGNLLLPAVLFAAGFHAPLKYLLPLPAMSIFVALSLAAYGAWIAFRADGPSLGGAARPTHGETP